MDDFTSHDLTIDVNLIQKNRKEEGKKGTNAQQGTHISHDDFKRKNFHPQTIVIKLSASLNAECPFLFIFKSLHASHYQVQQVEMTKSFVEHFTIKIQILHSKAC